MLFRSSDSQDESELFDKNSMEVDGWLDVWLFENGDFTHDSDEQRLGDLNGFDDDSSQDENDSDLPVN